MTLDAIVTRLGATLALCGVGVVVVGMICAANAGDAAIPAVSSLHHLIGLALAVFGAVLIIVGISLSMLTE